MKTLKKEDLIKELLTKKLNGGARDTPCTPGLCRTECVGSLCEPGLCECVLGDSE